MNGIVPRGLAPLVASMDITIPDQVDDLTSSMNQLGGAINAGGWATAAVVYAWTEPGSGGPRTGKQSNQLSEREFADLGIRGLESRPTVRKYRARWERAIERGWAKPVARGETLTLPSRDFREEEAHVGANSGENEWYTPREIIRSASRVMVGIDLDPASTAEANEIVQAKTFYTAKDDGLSQPWFGKVWMNPPYARPLIDQFSEKLADEYAEGRVKQAIVLVNNATDTSWFAQLADLAAAVCFTRGRVKFWHPDRESAPLQGQAILYFPAGDGQRASRFASEFKAHGHVWRAA